MSNPVETRSIRRIPVWLILSVFAIIALIRLWQLDRYDIWYDEAFSIYMANHMKPLWTGEYSFHPPGFYILITPWIKLFPSPFGLRMLPYLFGLATIWAGYLLLDRLFDRITALTGMILAGFAPLHVYYSREFRMYAIVGFLYVLSWLLLISILEKPSAWNISVYVLSWALFFYLHYYSVFGFAAQGLAVLFLDIGWRKRWRLYACMVLSGLLFLPWAGRLLTVTDRLMVKGEFWAPQINLKWPFKVLRVLIAGYESPRWLANPMVMAAALAMLICIWNCSYRPKIILVFAALVPFILSITIGYTLDFNYLIARYVLFLVVPVSLCMAAGITRLRWYIGLPLFVILIGLQTGSLGYQYRNLFHDIHWDHGVRPKKEHRAAAEYIAERLQPGDVIGHACTSSYGPFYYYLQFRKGVYPGRPVDLDRIILGSYDRMYAMNGMYDNFGDIISIELDAFIRNAERLWFVASEWDVNAYGTFSTDFRWKLQKHIESRFPVIERKHFYGVPVILFDLQKPLSDSGEITKGT